MRSVAAPAVRRCRPWLGTFVEITIPDGCDGAAEAGFAAIAHIHRLMSFHEDGSDLAALRRAPAGTIVEVGPETVAVLRISAMLAERSGGLFDVTVGARLAAWGFLPMPCDAHGETLPGTAADIALVDDTHVVCRRPMLIDLGGIAKGFAVDCAVDALRAAGVPRGIVNAGGDLRVFGDRAETVHLRGSDGIITASVEVSDAALASSSNAHLRRQADGREASPHVGRDGAAVLAVDSVTVIARRCVIADAMTKIALADAALAEGMLAELDGALVPHPTSHPRERLAA